MENENIIEIVSFVIFSIVISISLIGILLMIIGLVNGINIKKRKSKTNLDVQKTSREFEIIYNELYNTSYFWELEKSRKKIKTKIIILSLLVGMLTLWYLILTKIPMDIELIVFNAIIFPIIYRVVLYILVFMLVISYKDIKKYKTMYKENVLSEFVTSINDNFKYNYKQKDIELDKNLELEYKKACFDDNKYNIFKSDDYIEGILDESIFIKIVDIHLKASRTDIFEGLFTTINCNRAIGEYIKIVNNTTKILEQKDKIYMDSGEFERIFNVYTSDRNVATRFLTSDIMQELIDFYNKYNIIFEIVIRDKNIYLRFHTGRMFEPKVFGSSMDKALLYRYYCILEFVLLFTKKVINETNEINI